MGLSAHQWGDGSKLAVLLHGMADDSTTWRRFGQTLAALGYRVFAPDLPGHGRSSAMPGSSAEEFTTAVLDVLPREPDLAVGHSLGGMVLSLLAADVRATRTVYSETLFRPPPYGDLTAGELADALASSVHPVGETGRWDPKTTAGFLHDIGGTDLTPDPMTPSLVQYAESGVISGSEAARLRRAGLITRSVPGADHAPHVSSYDEFLSSLDGWI
ncbi:alpha/beta fold hydrolase [Stackebrandtia endophytica]|nr:alpha/beta fold hydrolase [Stackebrandtia endophytica]